METKSKIKLNVNGTLEKEMLKSFKDKHAFECSDANNKITNKSKELSKRFPFWKIYTDTREEHSLLRVLYIQELSCKGETNSFLFAVYLVNDKEVDEKLINEKDSQYIVEVMSLTPQQLTRSKTFLYPDAFSNVLGFIFLIAGGEDMIHKYINQQYSESSGETHQQQ